MHEKPNIPFIPLETFKNFFCIDFDAAFQNSLTNIAPNKSKEMVGVIFVGLGLDKQKDEWDRLSTLETTHIGIVTGTGGSFFMHIYSEDAGIEHHSLISGFCNTIQIDGQERASLEIHSLFCGSTIQGESDINVSASVCICRSYVNDAYEESLVTAETPEQFFAFLCYMRHILSTCLAGDQIELSTNAAWLTESSIEDSQASFNELLGMQSIEEVVSCYNAFKTEIAAELEKIDLNPDAQDYINQLPTRFLQ